MVKRRMKAALAKMGLAKSPLRTVLSKHADKINSFSQYGEDLVIDAILQSKSNGFYVDVGANDPIPLSNTYRFYQRGWYGINIEPQPSLHQKFLATRPRDINLNCGIAAAQGELKFYELEIATLSTFDYETALENSKRFKARITRDYSIPVYPLASILEKYLPNGMMIDFMSVDTEGFDLQVLQSNDWVRFHPVVIVVELGDGRIEIDQYLGEQGYVLVYTNSTNGIYVRDEAKN